MTDKNYIADFGSAENVNDIIEKNISGGNMILMCIQTDLSAVFRRK